MRELKTGQDVVARLKELTKADKLYWEEQLAMGEVEAYQCRVGASEVRSGTFFQVRREGSGEAKTLYVEGNLVCDNRAVLATLMEDIIPSIRRCRYRSASDATATGIAKAAAALAAL